MDQIAKFYEELGNQVKQFPGGIDALAEASGVSKVTLWRWVNGINSKYPDQHRVLQVFIAISGKKSLPDLKSFFQGNLKEYLEKTTVNNGLTVADEKEFKLIDNYYSFLIYILTGNESGVSEDELIEICGHIASKKSGFEDLSEMAIKELGKLVLPKINELEIMEIIIKKDGRYFRNEKSLYIPFDEKKLIKYCSENLEYFTKPKDFPLDYNAFYAYTESIPHDLVKELASDTKKFYMECYKKMRNSKCQNGVPYQIMATAERLEFKPFFQENC